MPANRDARVEAAGPCVCREQKSGSRYRLNFGFMSYQFVEVYRLTVCIAVHAVQMKSAGRKGKYCRS